jgi:hypothetical protein
MTRDWVLVERVLKLDMQLSPFCFVKASVNMANNVPT